MTDRELIDTIPLARPRRLSREFLAVNVPLTPELERLHALQTARTLSPPSIISQSADARTTGRIGRTRRQYAWSRAMGAGAVVAAAMLGLCLGRLLAMAVGRFM